MTRSNPLPSNRGIARELIGSLMVSALILAAALALGGCYGSPIDTRAIDADKVTITHSTPWSSLTIQAEGWHSTVKAQGSETTVEKLTIDRKQTP